jgi:hypothetical protein
VFARLVGGIGNFVSRAAMGEPTTVTLADFLNGLGQGQGINSGDGKSTVRTFLHYNIIFLMTGLLTEIFNAVSTELTFIDLLTIFLGTPTPLANARNSLRNFVNTRVLENQPNTPENMRSGVDKLVEELEPDIQAINVGLPYFFILFSSYWMCSLVQEEASTKEDVDFAATLRQFIRPHFINLCEIILNTSENDETWSNNLVVAVRRVIHEFIMLCRSCLEGDVAALEMLVQARVVIHPYFVACSLSFYVGFSEELDW